MNIREFRALTDNALSEAGLKRLKLDIYKGWSLPGEDLERYFLPHAYRRPWGFVFSGSIGIEIPKLREWLAKYKPGDESGIFRVSFIGYNILNDKDARDLMVTHDDPVPVEAWAAKIRDKLEHLPPSVEGLIKAYRSEPEILGKLVQSYEKPAWQFLEDWLKNPNPSLLQVPRRSATGHIL